MLTKSCYNSTAKFSSMRSVFGTGHYSLTGIQYCLPSKLSKLGFVKANVLTAISATDLPQQDNRSKVFILTDPSAGLKTRRKDYCGSICIHFSAFLELFF